ncbi:hypothetical protein B0H15DRAFT_868871 [Mycena belliarum]|uniref:Uncharacterized protein n=1 Tax=Mycena belliarum TaxID=1033014 RepID=A0AAD6TN46_9AGAR|nr:hypothetical protein B0H15DRAFT_868871 [Mycena belliae]
MRALAITPGRVSFLHPLGCVAAALAPQTRPLLSYSVPSCVRTPTSILLLAGFLSPGLFTPAYVLLHLDLASVTSPPSSSSTHWLAHRPTPSHSHPSFAAWSMVSVDLRLRPRAAPPLSLPAASRWHVVCTFISSSLSKPSLCLSSRILSPLLSFHSSAC